MTNTAGWRLASLAVTLLAFGLRLVNLGGQSLWYDEAYQLLVSATPLDRLLPAVASDTNQPLSFLLWHLWGVGSPFSEVYARYPAALFGTIAVPLTIAAGRLLVGWPGAVAGGLLLAVAPFPLYYGQEARMYAMLLAWSALAGWAAAAGWQRRRWGWPLYALATACALYTHVLGALPCLVIAIWPLFRSVHQRKRAHAPLLALAIAGCAFLPWAGTLPSQAATVLATFWAPPPSPAAPLLSLYQLLYGPFVPPPLLPVGLAAVLLAAGLTLPTVLRPGAGRNRLGPLWCWLALPIIGLFALSLVRPVYLDRILIGASVPLVLLVGWTLTGPKPRPLGLAVGGMVVVLAMVGLARWYGDPAAGKPPYRAAVAELIARTAPQGPVVHTSDGSLLPFLLYAPSLDNRLLAGDPEHLTATSRAHSTLVTLGQRPETVEQAVGAANGFWVVVSLDHSLEFQRQVVADLDARYRLTQASGVPGLAVRYYTR